MALWPKKPDDNKKAPSAPSKPEVKAGADKTAAAPVGRPDAPSTPPKPDRSAALAAPAGAGPVSARPASPAQSQPPPQLAADELQKRAAASKQQMAAFGGIVSVLMRSPQFREQRLAELEALVVPAVVNNQYLLAEAQSKASGFVVPVGAVLWASVSAEVDRRLSENLDQPFKLAPNEWRSGDIGWLVVVVGDSRVINPMLKQLQETVLKGRPLEIRGKGKDGKEVVGTYSASAPPPAANPPPAP